MTDKKTAEIKISPHFFLRRLHSLTGVFPIGAFLFEHMFSNAYIVLGPEAYNKQIAFLNSFPYVELIEWTVIYIPILYHAFYGFYVMFSGKNNLGWYPYKENWLYSMQRWTGLITFAYIAYHVYHTKIVHELYGTEVSYGRMAQLMHNPKILWFYIIGTAAAMFHFANGLWGFLISWGFTVREGARRVSGWICTLVGFGLYFCGIASILHLIK